MCTSSRNSLFTGVFLLAAPFLIPSRPEYPPTSEQHECRQHVPLYGRGVTGRPLTLDLDAPSASLPTSLGMASIRTRWTDQHGNLYLLGSLGSYEGHEILCRREEKT
ncbi:hypothetical protein B0T10DRAFT_38687 [Thelonectria olida]|uniref:MHC class I antigen n=1 Tax=Thelonectria olida TaxID=1576542 RepID=A0A9P8W3J5_9HYPO|nr:hypothetical protein B0T10DRAFT_38687 [Thelonectria olida]